MTVFPHEFNGFAREITGALSPDLLQIARPESASTLDPASDHNAIRERQAMSHLTAIEGGTQAIPVVTCDAVIADHWIVMVRWLKYLEKIDPMLPDNPAYRATRAYVQSRWESAFEVLR